MPLQKITPVFAAIFFSKNLRILKVHELSFFNALTILMYF